MNNNHTLLYMTTVLSQHIKNPRSLSLRSLSKVEASKGRLGLSFGRLAALFALLFFSGSLWAQTDNPYVIKATDTVNSTDHYLTHVLVGSTWVLQDASTFDPETCIWYSGPKFNVSGTHHNYYFHDGSNYRFLSAPLETNADLGLSNALPTSTQLKNPDDLYYFYDWDWDAYGGGVARGHDDNGWWKVHWIAYSNSYHKWTTTADAYHITDSSARFRQVTVTPHERAVNWNGTDNNVGSLDNFSMEYVSGSNPTSHPLSITIGNYSYTCTPAYVSYVFEGTTYNYCDNVYIGSSVPQASAPVTSGAVAYQWTITGEGKDYLSFAATGDPSWTSEATSPMVYYVTENTTGTKTAQLTLTLTFGSGDTPQATLVREATITVLTKCQNPAQMAVPEVNYNDVTVRWYPVAQKYKVEWKPADAADWSAASSKENITHNFYTITDLTPNIEYQYRVTAYCDGAYLSPSDDPLGTFTPQDAPDLLIYGSVFGGGRMANVTDSTVVIIVNCDSIGAVYGGNDIAGEVQGAGGSTVNLGVTEGSGSAVTSAALKIGSVYGGGNGYYAYNGTSLVQAPESIPTVSVPASTSVMALSPANQWEDPVWTNPKQDSDSTLTLPSIVKTAVTVASEYVKVDSLFGGAKNAFLTLNNDQQDGSLITINNGIVFAVFGGNNFGGSQGDAMQHIIVNNTKTNLSTTKGLGRTHGIAYLFGGGNKVAGSTTNIYIAGGQLDTVFGGGNHASVDSARLEINCVGNKRISAAFNNAGVIDSNYGWDGDTIYNVHTLFGGNNRAHMNGVPNVILTSGGVGTAYGGGNAGDMLAHVHQSLDGVDANYGTHMVLNSPNMVVDFLYGGCQESNVHYSTWVQIQDGHVGTVYGGCNVSGDVGSTRLYPLAPAFTGEESNQSPNEDYQKVWGATWVKVTGGNIYRNLFAGSNGYYHCNDGVRYVSGVRFGDPDDGYPEEYDPDDRYLGLPVPTHNETNVKIAGGTIWGNVYAGGNLACVGFTDYTLPEDHSSGDGSYPTFVGMASVTMEGGHVKGSVYGGGNMASIYGSNSVQVSGGRIDGALYGGNDRTGQAAQITNRVLPDNDHYASDGVYDTEQNKWIGTNLTDLNVKTYVSITGHPTISTVYGGGNGDYDYEGDDAIQFCGLLPDEPIQSNTFVDVAIDNDGHIGTVYGGGNGVTVTGGITVFLNAQNPNFDSDNVGTIFGGNNKGALTLVPDIILCRGQVGTVYGGCNQGAMEGWRTVEGFKEVGSLVRLRSVYYTTTYNADTHQNDTTSTTIPDVKISNAVYGGCRMNGVSYSSLVLVEGGNHADTVYPNLFGGSDISGVVGDTSRVVIRGGFVGNAIGGGNGYYTYENDSVYTIPTTGDPVLVATGVSVKPYTNYSGIDMTGGTANNLYAGGNACSSGETLSTISGGTVNSGIYGGCNASGTIGEDNDLHLTGSGNIVLNVTGGTVGAIGTNNRANVHGGGYGPDTQSTGNVTVNIGAAPVAQATTPTGPTISGDIYGGSALGQVSASNKLTQVNFLGGTVNGDIYGGGLGQAAEGTVGASDYVPGIAAEVSGNVEVNIRGGVFNDATGTANAAGVNSNAGGKIFGCNNANGTPKGDVTVNIYATDHGLTPQTNLYPVEPPASYDEWSVLALDANAGSQAYAIRSVFGGGNLAAYIPDAVAENEEPHKSTVHVYNCDNTVKDVFGGGNAADVGTGDAEHLQVDRRVNTNVIVEGGRFHRVIGGGNGEDTNLPAANIFGTANTTVYAGLIDEVYGGANINGSVDGINLLVSNPSYSQETHPCTDSAQVYGKVFGCANAAPYNRSVTTTIACGVGEIGELYGGSNQASIGIEGSTQADVTLNVYGGTHNKVFAGSKGIAGNPGTPAPIYGNVTLNLYGGTITDAFGGSDANGNIAGIITVNVLDIETCHPLDVTNVYGASNQTPYNPDNVTINDVSQKPVSPVVNVIHIKNEHENDEHENVVYGIRNNVYGGGNLANTISNPQVNIGDYTGMSIPTPVGYNEYPISAANRSGLVSGNVYGGGNNITEANKGVEGNPVINMREKGTVITGIYGGCNTNGLVNGDINVNIYGGTLGTSSAKMREGIYGGGKGNATTTDGNITVTINKETDESTPPTVYADIYGGSAFGEVGKITNNDSTLALVNLKAGYVYGKMFGGGKGDVTNNYKAKVDGNAKLAIEGGQVFDSIFGGCNVKGVVVGNAVVDITGGTMGAAQVGEEGDSDYAEEVRANTYGGGLGENTRVSGDVKVTVNNSDGHVYGDVYGGSAKGLVNCTDPVSDDPSHNGDAKTEVTLTAGTLHGDLYGGGHGLNSASANVHGPVIVEATGGRIIGSAFGCNNLSGTPLDSVAINVSGTVVIDSIFGGGNVAGYVPQRAAINAPFVNISGGEVTHKVAGGGNAASVTANPHVNISGGRICTVTTGEKAGVYGGCNTSGTVTGNIFVSVTKGSAATEPVIGTQAALEAHKPVSIHGGGYGAGTNTTGDVTVTFGIDDGSVNAESRYPMLYGDLYGGSALGTVNDAGNDTTTVNVGNGSLQYFRHNLAAGYGYNQYGGNVYGGGLGEAGTANVAKGQVNGVVRVNIGQDGPFGKAYLKGCNVFGCNNTNGSPQKDVYVDVYQTAHEIQSGNDSVSYDGSEMEWNYYAIQNVYGGGNRAHYNPPQIGEDEAKVHNTIHYCENTVQNVYGGGNAADTYGTVVRVEGGRFKYIFGGGNGQNAAANIGMGGVDIAIYTGHVGWYFYGCNLHGTVDGDTEEHYGCDGVENCPCDADTLLVDNYYFGANEALTVNGLNHTINCGDKMTFKNVYAGSRLAVVYGDIKLTVRGGEIQNLFGGNEGSETVKADVRKYPEDWEDHTDDHRYDSTLIAYLLEMKAADIDLAGKGGNVTLVLEGGKLGNVYGGNRYWGNIEGDITIIVDSTQANPCQLDIDYLYGGNKLAAYVPDSCAVVGEGNQPCLTNRVSPKVYLKNGHVNFDVHGGSEGGNPDHLFGNGLLISNPLVVIGDSLSPTNTNKARVGRDIFGGGRSADMEGNPVVVLQGRAKVGGDVYGGAKSGNVTGNTIVNIDPTPPVSTPETPVPVYVFRYAQPAHGRITVTHGGQAVTNGSQFHEGDVLNISITVDEGYQFCKWIAPQGGINENALDHTSTTFTIGTSNAMLRADVRGDSEECPPLPTSGGGSSGN